MLCSLPPVGVAEVTKAAFQRLPHYWKSPELQWLPNAPHLQARRGKQVQLHEIKPFLQLSILSSSWHFSAEQHRNNSTAQSTSLITPINHRNDKTKPGRISHGNIFRRGQHLQLPLRRNNPCGLLGSADTFPEHSQSSGTSCQGLTTAGALCSSVPTATPSVCAASALGGREVKPRGIQGFSPFYPSGMGWEGLNAQGALGRFVLGGLQFFYLHKLTKLCGCAWQHAFHNRN